MEICERRVFFKMLWFKLSIFSKLKLNLTPRSGSSNSKEYRFATIIFSLEHFIFKCRHFLTEHFVIVCLLVLGAECPC